LLVSQALSAVTRTSKTPSAAASNAPFFTPFNPAISTVEMSIPLNASFKAWGSIRPADLHAAAASVRNPNSAPLQPVHGRPSEPVQNSSSVRISRFDQKSVNGDASSGEHRSPTNTSELTVTGRLFKSSESKRSHASQTGPYSTFPPSRIFASNSSRCDVSPVPQEPPLFSSRFGSEKRIGACKFGLIAAFASARLAFANGNSVKAFTFRPS